MTMRIDRRALLLPAVMVTFFLQLSSGPLNEPDEARYAEIAREMLATGDWVTPRVNGVPYFVKPPLVFWLTALSFRGLGETEFAARLVPAVAGAIGVAATVAIGTALYDCEVGFFSGLFLATTPLYFGLSQALTPDVPLTALLTIATGSFLVALRQDQRGRRTLILLGWVAAALSTLAKGFVGVVLPLAVTFVAIAVRRDWHKIRAIEWGIGLSFYAILVLPWFVLMSFRNPDFFWAFFVNEHVLRFASTVHHRGGPLLYYVPVLFLGGLPWSLGALAALPGETRRQWIPAIEAPASSVLEPALWVGIPFLFFSAAGSKLPSYILPVFPPVAILMGRLNDRLISCPVLKLLLVGGAGVVLFATGISMANPLKPPRWWIPARSLAPALLTLAVLLIGLMGGTLWVLQKRGRRRALGTMAAGVLALFLVAASKREGVPNERPLARAVAEHLPSGGRVVSYCHFVFSVPFYAHVEESVVKLPSWLDRQIRPGIDDRIHWKTDERLLEEWSSARPLLLVIPARDLDRLEPAMNPKPRIIGKFGRELLAANWD